MSTSFDLELASNKCRAALGGIPYTQVLHASCQLCKASCGQMRASVRLTIEKGWLKLELKIWKSKTVRLWRHGKRMLNAYCYFYQNFEKKDHTSKASVPWRLVTCIPKSWRLLHGLIRLRPVVFLRLRPKTQRPNASWLKVSWIKILRPIAMFKRRILKNVSRKFK